LKPIGHAAAARAVSRPAHPSGARIETLFDYALRARKVVAPLTRAGRGLKLSIRTKYEDVAASPRSPERGAD